MQLLNQCMAVWLIACGPALASPLCVVPLEEAELVPENIMVRGALRSAYIAASEQEAAVARSCACPFVRSWDDFMRDQFPHRDINGIAPTEARAIANAWAKRGRELTTSYSEFYRRACM